MVMGFRGSPVRIRPSRLGKLCGGSSCTWTQANGLAGQLSLTPGRQRVRIEPPEGYEQESDPLEQRLEALGAGLLR